MFSKLKKYWDYEQNRLFLWLPVIFGLGIAIYFMLPNEPSLWLGIILISITLLPAIICHKIRKFALILSVAAFGFTNIQLRSAYLYSQSERIIDKKLYVSGKIDKIDKNYRGRTRLVLSHMEDFDGNPIVGRYRLSMIHKDYGLKTGDCVEMIAVVSPPFLPSVAGGYQFNRKLFFENINGSGYIPSEVLPIDCTNKNLRLSDWAARLRQNINKKIYNVLPKDEAAVAVAIVAGDQTQISRELIEAYRNSGLAHFLSISGLHMSMLAGLMFLLVRVFMALIPSLALKYNSKKVAAVLSLIVSAVYLVISGAAIPAVRAFIMTGVVLTAVLFDRQAISMRTLAVAAMIVLIITPEALVGASFQMSFAAVVALVAFYEKYAGRLNRFLNTEEIGLTRKIARGIFVYLVGVVIADFVASIATLPFSIYHFNQIDYYTGLTNLLSGPIIGFVIMPFVLISLLVMPLGLESLPLKIVGYGLHLTNQLTLRVSSLPCATDYVMPMPVWGLALITLGGLWLCLWCGRWRRWGVLLFAAGCLSIVTTKRPEVIIDSEIKTVAVLNHNSGKYYFMPKAGRWNKQIWMEKFAAKAEKGGKKVLNTLKNPLYPKRVQIKQQQSVKVDGKEFDVRATGGVAIFADKDNLSIKTVRDYVGCRYWNCTIDEN